MVPFMFVGLLFSLGTGSIKEFVAPRAAIWAADFQERGYEEMISKIQRNLGDYNSKSRREWSLGQIDMKTPHILQGVEFTIERDDGTRIRKITAPRAESLDGQWWFYDPVEQNFNENDDAVDQPHLLMPVSNTVKEMVILDEHRPATCG